MATTYDAIVVGTGQSGPSLAERMSKEGWKVAVSRAVERSETDGFMKVLVDAETKEILGAAILGISGDEVVHVLLDVMYTKKPCTVIQRAVHIHPTVAELLPTLLGELKPLQ